MAVTSSLNDTEPAVRVTGLPRDVCPVERNILVGRLQKAAREFLTATESRRIDIGLAVPGHPTAESGAGQQHDGPSQPDGHRDRRDSPAAGQAEDTSFAAVEPLYSWDRVILPGDLRDRIESAVEAIRHSAQLFDAWGLREIEPFPRAALNFHGPPGTGKTLTAHAVASMLGRPIIVASYAQIESRYLGDGPKNAARLFESAEESGAVLFIDEADSLLSARLTNATQGSERAANSLTSQLLISLERFSGIVIFATNLLDNYDRAFDTRVQHIAFSLPDESTRREIWKKHLPSRLPLAPEVSVDELAQVEGVCGRDIRNAVIMAATRTVRAGENAVSRDVLLDSVDRVRESQDRSNAGSQQKLTDGDRGKILQQMKDA